MVTLSSIFENISKIIEPWQVLVILGFIIPMFYLNITFDEMLLFLAENISAMIIWYSERIIFNARRGINVLIPGLLKATEDGLEAVEYPLIDDIKMPNFPKIKI